MAKHMPHVQACDVSTECVNYPYLHFRGRWKQPYDYLRFCI